jgi:hypothetical protein
MLNTSTHRLALVASLLLAPLATGCAFGPAEPESSDGPEPVGVGQEASTSSVEHEIEVSCSTGTISGLSKQILEEGNCIHDGAYVKIPSRLNISYGSTVWRYMEKPAKDHLVAALDAHPGTHMTVDSMLRTIAQQYMLYRWWRAGRCGIPLAADPGDSNHETGLAIDVGNESTWRSILQNHSFHWLGSQDPEHFDYSGSGAVDHRGLDVKAFQRLWNRNHSGDTITVDGVWGPETEARMKKAPADGFAKGAQCASAHDAEVACDEVYCPGEPSHPVESVDADAPLDE